jgi:hypothetical protein
MRQASPWQTFHVQKGFKADENVISLFRGLGIVPGQGGSLSYGVSISIDKWA